MIEVLPNFPANVVAFACKGHVTRSDYEAVLVPVVEKAVREQPKIRLDYQIGAEFAGIAPGAMWEDFKVGMAHLTRWERIAVVTDVNWIRETVRMFRFLIPGKARVFPTSQTQAAREWIVAPIQ